MRRKDREITNIEEIIEIIKKCDVCRLAFFDDEFPYIIPLNFGFRYVGEVLELFFHGAKEGKKINLIKNNNKVSFEMDCSHRLITGEKACDYTMEFESVCGNGYIEFLDDSQKIDAFNYLMNQYSKLKSFEYNEMYLKEVAVFKVIVNDITGKKLKRT